MRWILLVALAACSSDKITSLDGDTVISALSADERKQLCSDFDHWADNNRVPANRRYSCALDALDPSRHDDKAANDSEAQQACRAFRDACNRRVRPDPKPVDCAEFTDELAACPGLTIREFDECTREDVANVKRIVEEEDLCVHYRKSFTTDDYLRFLRRDKSVGPKCRVMNDKCPKR